METLENLKRRISNTEDLHSVVRTMKTMAAVNIHQYEQASRSMRRYSETVVQGLQGLFMGGRAVPGSGQDRGGSVLGVVAMGSDQGMCGRLNEDVAEAVSQTAREHGGPVRVLAMGARLEAQLEEADLAPDEIWPVPASARQIASRVRDMQMGFEAWGDDKQVASVLIVSPERAKGGAVEPKTTRLLPLDRQWIMEVAKRKWPTNQVPMVRMNPPALYTALVRQYLFSMLHMAMAECLASENQSRLESMQGAQRNIEDQLDELSFRFHQARQSDITDELLDIVSGFEAFGGEGA